MQYPLFTRKHCCLDNVILIALDASLVGLKKLFLWVNCFVSGGSQRLRTRTNREKLYFQCLNDWILRQRELIYTARLPSHSGLRLKVFFLQPCGLSVFFLCPQCESTTSETKAINVTDKGRQRHRHRPSTSQIKADNITITGHQRHKDHQRHRQRPTTSQTQAIYVTKANTLQMRGSSVIVISTKSKINVHTGQNLWIITGQSL